MNNPLSYCGLVDVKIRASDKNLPVRKCLNLSKLACHYHNLLKKDTKNFFDSEELKSGCSFSLRGIRLRGRKRK